MRRPTFGFKVGKPETEKKAETYFEKYVYYGQLWVLIGISFGITAGMRRYCRNEGKFTQMHFQTTLQPCIPDNHMRK